MRANHITVYKQPIKSIEYEISPANHIKSLKICIANHIRALPHTPFHRVHTTSSLQKVITFYDYFSKKKYDLFMTSAIFLCRGLMFSNDVTH